MKDERRWNVREGGGWEVRQSMSESEYDKRGRGKIIA